MNDKLIKIFIELCKIHNALGNKYETQAYKKLITILRKYPKKINKNSLNELKNIDGIGKNTLYKIDEILQTGKLKLLEDMKKDKIINARLKLQTVMGIGPELSKKLIQKNIYNINQLKKANKNGTIKLTHMQKIGIKYYDSLNTKIPRKEITSYKNNLTKILQNSFPDIEIQMSGSYRLGKLLSNDIDIILTSPKIKTKNQLNKSNIFEEIIKLLINKKLIIDTIYNSKNNFMGITNTSRHIDIKFSPYNLLPFFLLYFGSGELFSRNIRQEAKIKGYKLSEWGIYKGNKIIMNKAVDEKQIFNKLGIKYIIPQNR